MLNIYIQIQVIQVILIPNLGVIVGGDFSCSALRQ